MKIVGKCKNCGADIYKNEGQEKCFCSQCGTQFFEEKHESATTHDTTQKPKSFTDIAQGTFKDLSDTTKSYVNDAVDKVKDSTKDSFNKAMSGQTYSNKNNKKILLPFIPMFGILIILLLFLGLFNSTKESGNDTSSNINLKQTLIDEHLISDDTPSEVSENAFTGKPQRNGFDDTKDIQVGLYSITIPSYFDGAQEETDHYLGYAETDGKVAFLNFRSSYDDEDPATFDEMTKEKNHNDYVDVIVGQFENGVLISDEFMDAGDVKGNLLIVEGDMKGYHTRQYNFHFPSEKDNNWVYISITETDNCEYDYQEEFARILDSISIERTVKEASSLVKDKSGLPQKNGFADETNNLAILGSIQFDIPCYWNLDTDDGEIYRFYTDDGITSMLLINRIKGSYDKNAFDRESTRQDSADGTVDSLKSQSYKVEDLEVSKANIGDKAGCYLSFTATKLLITNHCSMFSFVADDGDIYSVTMSNTTDCKYSYFDDFIKIIESAKPATDDAVSTFTHKASELNTEKPAETADNKEPQKADSNASTSKSTTEADTAKNEAEEKEDQEKKAAEESEKNKIKALADGKNVSEARTALKNAGYTATYTHDYTLQDFNGVIESYSDKELDEAGFIVTKVGSVDLQKKTIKLYVDTTENIASREKKESAKTSLEDKFDPLYAVSAVEQYGKKMYPYGFALHQMTGVLAEEPYDENTWFIKYKCWYKDMFGNKIETECEAKVTGSESNPEVYDFYVYD